MHESHQMTTLFDTKNGESVPLSTQILDCYGELYMPSRAGGQYVISDYVVTMDGVAALGSSTGTDGTGHASGAVLGSMLSGSCPPDLMLLALLHAISDVLIIGDIGLNGTPGKVMAAEHIYPPFAAEYRQTRVMLGKSATLPIVVISPDGNVDPNVASLHAPDVAVTILCTEAAVPRLRLNTFGSHVEIIPMPTDAEGIISPRLILATIADKFAESSLVLADAGPRFMGHLIAENCLDDLFLTIAPQIAGRDRSSDRPGFDTGRLFLPDHPRWGTLASIKIYLDYLFLRYQFNPAKAR